MQKKSTICLDEPPDVGIQGSIIFFGESNYVLKQKSVKAFSYSS